MRIRYTVFLILFFSILAPCIQAMDTKHAASRVRPLKHLALQAASESLNTSQALKTFAKDPESILAAVNDHLPEDVTNDLARTMNITGNGLLPYTSKVLCAAKKNQLVTLAETSNTFEISASPCGSYLVCGIARLADIDSFQLQVWDVAHGELVYHEEGSVNQIAWNPAGDSFAYTTDEGAPQVHIVCKMETDWKKSLRIDQMLGYADKIAWNNDGIKLLTYSYSGNSHNIQIWDTKTGEQLYKDEFTVTDNTNVLAVDPTWSPDGSLLVYKKDHNALNILDSTTGKTKQINLKEQISPVAWNYCGTYIACGVRHAPKLYLIDPSTEQSYGISMPLSGGIKQLRWNPRDNSLACASGASLVSVYLPECIDMGAQDMHPIKVSLKGHKDMIRKIAWSPDGRLLASASRDKTVKVWDVSKGKKIQSISSPTQAMMQWMPDSAHIIISSGHMYHALTGAEMVCNPGEKVAITPDGKRLFFSGFGRAIRSVDTQLLAAISQASFSDTMKLRSIVDSIVTPVIEPFDDQNLIEEHYRADSLEDTLLKQFAHAIIQTKHGK